MMQGYELPLEEMLNFLEEVIVSRDSKDPAWQAVSKNRRSLLPFGAIAMREVLRAMKPAKIAFSAQGVARRLSYSLLSETDQNADPLLVAADELAILRAVRPNMRANWRTGADEPSRSSGSRRRKKKAATVRQPACSPISAGARIRTIADCRRSISSPIHHSWRSPILAAPT